MPPSRHRAERRGSPKHRAERYPVGGTTEEIFDSNKSFSLLSKNLPVETDSGFFHFHVAHVRAAISYFLLSNMTGERTAKATEMQV
jgi:hypothetical protein